MTDIQETFDIKNAGKINVNFYGKLSSKVGWLVASPTQDGSENTHHCWKYHCRYGMVSGGQSYKALYDRNI